MRTQIQVSATLKYVYFIRFWVVLIWIKSFKHFPKCSWASILGFSVKVNRTNHANEHRETGAQLATACCRDFSSFIYI